MRLLNAHTHTFQHFFGRPPPYASLSHTWEREEASHQDVQHRIPSLDSKQGYRKIQEVYKIAAEQGFDWVWADTCCIDKANNAELAESINSMFRWYQQAAVCIVYLSGLSAEGELKTSLPKCRWFKRGWTLQELLAPSKVQFYDQAWNLRGTKDSLIVQLESITGIPEGVLTGRISISEISIADRMSWAANRQTTRSEDVAYCLFGIFDVNMPMIYGEGRSACRRLQEHIILKSNDMTIFAWQYNDPSVLRGPRSRLLADSPDGLARRDKNKTVSILSMRNAAMSATINPEYIVTNKGLRITSSLLRLSREHIGEPDDGGLHYFLGVGEVKSREAQPSKRGKMIGIAVDKIGSDTFVRRNGPLRILSEPDNALLPTTSRGSFHIQIEPAQTMNKSSVVDAIAFPVQRVPIMSTAPRPHEHPVKYVTIKPGRTLPESHWDETRQLFFRSSKRLLVMAISAFVIFDKYLQVELLMLVDQRASDPAVHLFLRKREPALYEWFISRKAASGIHYWEELPGDLSQKVIPRPESRVEVIAGGRKYVISACVQAMKHPKAVALYQVMFKVDEEREDGEGKVTANL
ncbi:heterokaryon incompatibility protein-domain-containing protein [Triangularia verruculosa]|uniref:Heterokaryon incompatibility protein-domain-containing protein n=1 Tax=Triangularia verruculosa TaxID=2587418 RepID=A0AAN6X9H1_9PEZI|nr:heterokaryon incompatibility protein-domain-containing protein [Triangularia verruculosa]